MEVRVLHPAAVALHVFGAQAGCLPARPGLRAAQSRLRARVRTAPRRLFFRIPRVRAGGLQAGVAQLLADLDEFSGQPAQTLALVDLSARLVYACGWDGPRGLLAGDLAQEHEVGAMPGMTGLLATAIRLTTFLISVAQRSGAQISDGGESTPNMVAAFLQGTDRFGCRHAGLPVLTAIAVRTGMGAAHWEQ